MSESPRIERSSIIVKKYNIKLAPITPIHVWSGIDVVIDINAFIYNNNLYVLDDKDLSKLSERELSEAIEKKPTEMYKYIFSILVTKGVLKPYAQVSVTPEPKSSLKLIHNNIVPGSTLKGYIRTAIIRFLLNQHNSETLLKILSSGIDLYKKPPRVSEELEARLLRKERLREQGGFVDVLEILQVSDPEVYEKAVVKTLRKLIVADKFNVNNIVARLYAVVLDPPTCSESTEPLRFSVKVLNPDLNLSKILAIGIKNINYSVIKEILDLRSKFIMIVSDKDRFIEILRIHGCKLIDLELSKVQFISQTDLDNYRKLLENIRSKLCVERTNCIPARIGFMTGHEAKTVLDIVKQHDPGLYRNIIDYMREYVHREWDERTLKLVDYNGELMGIGWCKLCIE